MLRFLLCCAVTLAVPGLAPAQMNQIWAKHHNGGGNSDDYGLATAVDLAGNVYFTGSATNSLGLQEFFTAKYNSNGQKLWKRTYSGGGGGPDKAWVIAVDPLGNAVVAGDTVGAVSGNDIAVLKYDPLGNLLWSQSYDGPASGEDGIFGGLSLGVDALGDVVVGGYSEGLGSSYDWVVIKYSAAGALLWEDRINGSGNAFDDCYGIDLDAAGNIYAGGEFSNASMDISVVKYDPDGNVLWKRDYDGPTGGQDWFYQLDVDSFGNVAVGGSSPGIGTGYDFVTLAYDTHGGLLFAQHYDGPAHKSEVGFAVAIGDAGLVATTGYSEDEFWAVAAVVMYDLAGNQLWTHQHYVAPYSRLSEGYRLQFDANGNLLMLGVGWSGPETGHDTFLVKFSPAGLVLEEAVYDGAGHADDIGLNFTQVGNGNIYIAFYSQRGAKHLDGTLLKLGPGMPIGTGPGGQMTDDGELFPVTPLQAAAPAVAVTPRALPLRPGPLQRLLPAAARPGSKLR